MYSRVVRFVQVFFNNFSFTIKLFMNTANESQKENNFFPTDPPALRVSKTPFLMGIIWSIQCAVLFLPRREMQWLFVYCKQGFFFGTRVAFRTRNTFVVCALRTLLFSRAKISPVIWALQAVLLERGILYFWCTSLRALRTRNTLFFIYFSGAFRTTNTHVVCALHAVLLERGILLFFVHFVRCFSV